MGTAHYTSAVVRYRNPFGNTMEDFFLEDGLIIQVGKRLLKTAYVLSYSEQGWECLRGS